MTRAASLPAPEQTGDSSGEVLLVSWGSNWGPVREALTYISKAGVKAGHLHLRHLSPMPNGLEQTFARYHKIVVLELNDEGLYGYGQLTTLLRARHAMPNIVSVTKTDGLTFKVTEIVAGVAKHIESTELNQALATIQTSPLARV